MTEREIDLERKIASFAELEDADREEGNESLADVWRNLREKAEAKRRRQHSHAEAH